MSNDNVSEKIRLPITIGMVNAGIAALDRLTQVDTPVEDATDAQVVIAIFRTMWHTYMQEQQADMLLRASKLKLIRPDPKPLVLPTKGH